jgi:hypothetical protein
MSDRRAARPPLAAGALFKSPEGGGGGPEAKVSDTAANIATIIDTDKKEITASLLRTKIEILCQ